MPQINWRNTSNKQDSNTAGRRTLYIQALTTWIDIMLVTCFY